jgi:hypothetical protein
MHVLSASIALLALLHMGGLVAAQAGAPREHAGRLAQAEDWLHRLEGRFRLKVSDPGDAQGVALEGSGECQPIDEGRGLNCLFQYESRSGRSQFLLLLLGLDPLAPAIRVTQLVSGGVPFVSQAPVEGDLATFPNDCTRHQPGSFCIQDMQIRAPADRRYVEVTMSGRTVPQAGNAVDETPPLRLRMEFLPEPQGG